MQYISLEVVESKKRVGSGQVLQVS